MLILKPITDLQEVKVFSREHDAPGEDYDVIVTNEETQASTSQKAAGVYSGTSLTLDITFNFIDGRFYTARIYHPITGALLNYSKIYVTAQTDLEKYTVLDGYYQEINKDNPEFIVKP